MSKPEPWWPLEWEHRLSATFTIVHLPNGQTWRVTKREFIDGFTYLLTLTAWIAGKAPKETAYDSPDLLTLRCLLLALAYPEDNTDG